jgi:hypothetical protein
MSIPFELNCGVSTAPPPNVVDVAGGGVEMVPNCCSCCCIVGVVAGDGYTICSIVDAGIDVDMPGDGYTMANPVVS